MTVIPQVELELGEVFMSLRRTAFALSAVVGLLAGAAPVSAGSPTPAATVNGNSDFRLLAQKDLADGRVVSTFASAEGSLRTVGRKGMAVSVNVTKTAATKDEPEHGSVTVSFDAPTIDKADPKAREAHGKSAVQTLIDMGVDPAVAKRDFGDFDAPTASASSDVTLAVAKSAPAPSSVAPAVSTTVPWDTQCADLNYAGGKITGRGCSTIYLTSASGGNWWFESKYKITASSSDTGLFPVRVKGLGWKLTWNDTNTEVTDWEPHTTITVSSCANVMLSGIVISITFNLCPQKESPWDVTRLKSGAIWSGVERDNDPVGAGGTQQDHNPVAATSTSHYSTFSLSW